MEQSDKKNEVPIEKERALSNRDGVVSQPCIGDLRSLAQRGTGSSGSGAAPNASCLRYALILISAWSGRLIRMRCARSVERAGFLNCGVAFYLRPARKSQARNG